MADGKVEMFAAAVCGSDGVQLFANERPVALAGGGRAFDPKDPDTRARMAKLLQGMRLYQQVHDLLQRAHETLVGSTGDGYDAAQFGIKAMDAVGKAIRILDKGSDKQWNLSSPALPALFADVGQQERVQRQETETEAVEETEPTEACNDAAAKKLAALATPQVPADEMAQFAIEVEGEDQYEFTWGHKPRGQGSWAFEIGGKTEFIPGLLTYTEAKKAAGVIAAERGVSTIKVLT